MRKRIVGATPILCLLVYLFIGFMWDIWSPTWLIFLLIPAMPFLLGLDKIRITYPLLVIIVYVVLGIVFKNKWWHPGWLIFLTIPVFYILFPSGVKFFHNRKKDTVKVKLNSNDDVIDEKK